MSMNVHELVFIGVQYARTLFIVKGVKLLLFYHRKRLYMNV